MKSLLIALMALVPLVAGSAPPIDSAPWLRCDTTYQFVFGQASNDSYSPAWPLAWEGTVQGGVNGVIRWWVDTSEGVYPNYVGRWELLDCDPTNNCPYDGAPVIMAGYSAGATITVVDDIAEWSGKGVVTFVGPGYPEYDRWFGRRTSEGGWYDSVDTIPNYGEGYFTIYDKPFNRK